MPKIEPDRKSLPSPVLRYKTVKYPKILDDLQREIADLRNLQICTCNHDRCCHSSRAGEGEQQILILDCPSAGKCLVKGCKCGAFVFSTKLTPVEGKNRRLKEKELSKVFPPHV